MLLIFLHSMQKKNETFHPAHQLGTFTNNELVVINALLDHMPFLGSPGVS